MLAGFSTLGLGFARGDLNPAGRPSRGRHGRRSQEETSSKEDAEL